MRASLRTKQPYLEQPISTEVVFFSIFCLLALPQLFFIGLAQAGMAAGLKNVQRNVLFNK